jgi:hypothetical protein
MSTQPLPSASQRCHRYVWAIGWVPVQVPGVAVSVSPCFGVPEMVGSVTGEGVAALTVPPVSADVATVEPPALVAVTARRTRLPTSAGVSS